MRSVFGCHDMIQEGRCGSGVVGVCIFKVLRYVVGFLAASRSPLWVLRVGGCGFFGLGSVVAGGLPWLRVLLLPHLLV